VIPYVIVVVITTIGVCGEVSRGSLSDIGGNALEESAASIFRAEDAVVFYSKDDGTRLLRQFVM
jgi:hypothetical protein